ncbi:MAG TPA: fibronectin type III domain-containing protein [Flavipsychrobacter sp.]|nr:fibronectin type III domain-containing protein [Flavipsychrobacter sp.]
MATVALKMHRMSAADLIQFAYNVHNLMVTNATEFTNPPVTLAALLLQIQALETAQQATINGGSSTIVVRNARRKELEFSMKNLAFFVNTVSGGVPEIINLSGMPIKTVGPRRYDTLSTPQNVSAISVYNGEVKLRWRKIHNAKSYLVEHAPDPLTGTQWQNGVHNSGANATVYALTQGKKYWFRVQAIGSEGLSSDWSEPICKLVV